MIAGPTHGEGLLLDVRNQLFRQVVEREGYRRHRLRQGRTQGRIDRMARIAVVNFMTLDGVIQSVLSADEDREGGFEAGGWVQPYMDGVVGRTMSGATTGAGGFLLGRKTYQQFFATWSV